MKQFIKLTRMDAGFENSSVFVKVDNIEWINSIANLTTIMFHYMDYIVVKETPEEIIELIEGN